jgi:hypothetical protein
LVFKDRAACRCRGFLLPSSHCSAAPCSTSGLRLLFRSGFPVKRPSPLRFHRFVPVRIPHRAFALCFFLSGEERLLPPPHLVSTCFVDFVFRLSRLRPELSAAVAASLIRPRGAASTTTALGVNPLRRPSSSHSLGSLTVVTAASSRGAASTTAALRVNSVLPTPYSAFDLVQHLPPPVRRRRVEGRGFYHCRVWSQHASSTPSSRRPAWRT